MFSITPLPVPAGVNNTCGIDAMNPSSKDDFTEFGKLLKEKITQYEKSLHYAGFLEALLRDVCISCKSRQVQHCWQSCGGAEVENMLIVSVQRGSLCVVCTKWSTDLIPFPQAPLRILSLCKSCSFCTLVRDSHFKSVNFYADLNPACFSWSHL